MMRGPNSRRGALYVLAGYGVVLVILSLGYLVYGHGDLFHSLLELLILGGLAALTLGVVYRLPRSEIDDDLYPVVVRWWAGGVGFVLLVSVLTVSYLDGSFLDHDAIFGYGLGTGLGGLGGLLIGYHEARTVTEARERTRTEGERRRLEHLNDLLRHDVLNNLAVIEGNLELLIDDADDEAAVGRLETVRTQARQATEHIQNVRLLVQTGRDERPTERVDLASTVEDELSHLREVYPDAEIDDDVPVEVYVRADDLLGSVLENLVRNAIQHNDKDRPRVAVAVDPGDHAATITVSDNGPGVPPTVRDSLYQPPAEGDHGLGLHLVRMLVERYRGSISILGDGSEGTTVVVELPRA